MGQEQPTSGHDDQPELERTQPSRSQPHRDLDWRPPDYRPGGDVSGGESPPVRRVQRHASRRHRPPTEGAPAWVVGLGIGALVAVIILLALVFLLSRRPAESAPTPTANVVTPTATLAPRPTLTPVAPATVTSGTGATEEVLTPAPPADTISVGGFVRVIAQAGLSFRQSPSTNGALIVILDAGSTLEVIGGPQEADGYVWWQLRTEDGREGWSAVGAGEDIFLQPAPAP
jgi:hypothetical protein